MSEVQSMSGNTEPQALFNIEAEQALIGAILIDNEVFHRVSLIAKPDDFFDPVHGRIFEVVSQFIAGGKLVSPVTLKTVLASDKGLAELGGPQYLVRMAKAAVATYAARDYAEMIAETARARRLYRLMSESAAKLADGEKPDVITDEVQQAIQAQDEVESQETVVSLLKAATKGIEDAAAAYRGDRSFLKTGITALDKLLKGLGGGDLMLLGGATSMGKTVVAVEIARNVAVTGGGRVAYWSLEMAPDQISSRIQSTLSGVPYGALRDPESLKEEDFRKWAEAGLEIKDAKLAIIPPRVRKLEAGISAIMRAKRAFNGLDLVIIDFAQLVDGGRRDLREGMVVVATGLKGIAQTLDCPVIGLVQVARDLETRENKRPRLTDIKESAAFEQAADQVVMVHSEHYYLMRGGPKVNRDGKVTTEARADFEADLAAHKGKLELIVQKSRHGGLGTALVGADNATNKIWRLDHRDVEVDF